MPPRQNAPKPADRSNNEVRTLLLEYFYERNKRATSARGKQGFAVKITDVRKDLKSNHGLSQQQVIGNLNYLMSQGWIAEDQVVKSVPLPSGAVIPQATSYYKITASGIDKIEGPGEFTMDRFKGIKIEATGQNIITLGDGNQVSARFVDAGKALSDLRQAIVDSTSIDDGQKLDAVADIDSVESQLAKREPNKSVIKGAWDGVKKLDSVLGLVEKVGKVGALLAPFLS